MLGLMPALRNGSPARATSSGTCLRKIACDQWHENGLYPQLTIVDVDENDPTVRKPSSSRIAAIDLIDFHNPDPLRIQLQSHCL